MLKDFLGHQSPAAEPKDPLKEHPTWSVIDSSKATAFMTCPRFYFFRYIAGLSSDTPNHNLVFGSAFHKALEVLLKEGYSLASIEKGMKAFEEEYRQHFSQETDFDYGAKNPHQAKVMLLEYIKQFKDDNFQNLYTEVSGSVPISSNQSLWFKLDSINLGDEGIFSLEHKTSSTLYSWWIDHWFQSFQVGAYTHVLYSYFGDKHPIFGVYINGFFFRKSSRSGKGSEILRIPIKFSYDSLEDWLAQAQFWLTRIEEETHELTMTKPSQRIMRAFPKNTSKCVHYNRLCSYFHLCSAWKNPIPHLQENVPAGFKIDFWDPREITENKIDGGAKNALEK